MPLSRLSGIQLSLSVAECNSSCAAAGPRQSDQGEHAKQSESTAAENNGKDVGLRASRRLRG
jgi:hypothetical protein